ncbi:MAG: hypothetical protein U1F87_12565 [Kiritimatiellia bacterium]
MRDAGLRGGRSPPGRSSRLLHGGIRYLGQGRVGLVREAGREKAVLRRIAPHLFAPLPFLYPALKGGPWSPAMLRIGTDLRPHRPLARELTCAASRWRRSPASPPASTYPPARRRGIPTR